ncbi:hypothetical protein EX895_003273 [Sporisorium graminicola]|uniref:Pre-mRNA-splicing factor PRP46 n=1 Tax=Sporisorium graminicola TaxID=280036 RepID=A0A4U7KXX6_9BASI|nr:hypothetical protein EX895_003273 [Sporisorium graminicola]TKY87692.1 hypothetical protein EX895_003273 [Sporisorium graminicola]
MIAEPNFHWTQIGVAAREQKNRVSKKGVFRLSSHFRIHEHTSKAEQDQHFFGKASERKGSSTDRSSLFAKELEQEDIRNDESKAQRARAREAMAQHGRDANSHPDEPPPKRRTLQIKLGRPRPSSDIQQAEQASPSLNRTRLSSSFGGGGGIRISLKRKASVPESQATPPRFTSLHAESGDEDDHEDQGQVGSADDSEQEESDEEEEDDDDDDDQAEDEDGEGEEGADDHDQEQNEETGAVNAATSGDAASNPRIRGKNGAFKGTSAAASSSHPSRRPIKRLRSKGLYEALPKLIENLQRRDSYKFFCEPVNPDEVPGYSDVIKTPMDFGTMQRKVDDRLYSHMDEFQADFQLVVSNAMTFNPEGTLYYNEAKRITAWGNRAIEREGMAVNDNGRAGVKGDEIRRQKRLAREAAASTLASGSGLDGSPAAAESFGRRQLRGAALHQHQALGDASMQQAADAASAGLDDETTRRSAARGSRFAFSAGVQAIMEAARVTSQARQRAAIALGLTGGTLTREDSVQPGAGFKGQGDADMDIDDDDDDEEVSDEEGGARVSVARERELRERSATADGTASTIGRRFDSSQPGGTPSTPLGQRQASPDALRRRLAAVTGTPIQALASPMGIVAGAASGTSRASKHAKHKQRLGAPGTPKRLLARTGLTGSATPLAGTGAAGAATTAAGTPAEVTTGADAAAAAQLIANLSQTQLQPSVASYSFDDDGSINPEDIDDLHAFLTLHRSDKHVLMPVIESLYPIPFVPGDYTNTSGIDDKHKESDKETEKERYKEKEKAKDKNAADDGDDDDDEGKGDAREKGDKDPLSTLPPSRPGAPDPLYSAIAPEPEPLQSNLSHDVESLPPNFRNLPFHTPSLPAKSLQGARSLSTPSSWSNPAYAEALKNDRRPKKQKDKEREKERETLEDWSYFRPTLARLLEITDLGPFGALVPRVECDNSSSLSSGKSIKDAQQAAAATSPAHAFSTSLLGRQGVEAIKAELRQKRQGLTLPREIVRRYIAAARNCNTKAIADTFSEVERQDASRSLSDMVYAGVAGHAYVRSVGEFVAGATHHAMLLDEADDANEQQIAEAERRLLLAAALRKVKDAEATPEPTAASRRGPFQWRDTTEEVSGGTATPSVAPENVSGQPDATSTARGTPAAEVSNAVDSAISELLEECDKVEAKLAPLPKPLAKLVEEEVIRPITGQTLDVLHLVAVHIKSHGSEALDVEEIEARLLQNKIRPHRIEGVDAALLAAPPAKPTVPSAAPVDARVQPQPQPPVELPPIPYTAELDWLKDQPDLTRLLDEARHDVDSLGSILNYVVQSA